MGDRTAIEWCNATWNPLVGCSRVSEGCQHCYAERHAYRFSGVPGVYEGTARLVNGHPTFTGRVNFNERVLDLPLRWKRPRRIFVNSMSDLFHENVSDEWIDRVFAIMASASRHTFQVLTKRPERALAYMRRVEAGAAKAVHDYLNSADYKKSEAACAAIGWDVDVDPPTGELRFLYDRAEANNAINEGRRGCGIYHELHWRRWPLSNVWLGVSVENQVAADERIPLLLQTPAAVRFLSCEPLLGRVDLCEHLGMWWNQTMQCFEGMGSRINASHFMGQQRIGWVIAGGESGPGARPMHPDWARSLRDQCAAAGVPFFFKQWGEWAPADDFASELQEHYDVLGRTSGASIRIGKKRAGHLLDGAEHHAFPEVRA